MNLDPNKRYLAVRLVSLKSLVDFVNARDDEYVYVTISFLKNRAQSKVMPASTDLVFDEDYVFEFEGEQERIKFDSSTMLKLKQPLHVTVLKKRASEKPVVIGSKNVEWRHTLACNSVETNAEILPVDLTHQGSLGVICLHLDLVPSLSKTEMIHE